MAKKSQRRGSKSLNATAESIGVALGHVAARLDSWKKQRSEIAADIQNILRSAQSLLGDLGEAPAQVMRTTGTNDASKRKGGRPKGYKMSEETKRKLRAAWKRRKADSKTKADA